MKFNFPINNFGAGEWSPKMQSRTDAEQYPRSCKELTNMLVQMQGGAQYRSGTWSLRLWSEAIKEKFDALAGATDCEERFFIIPYTKYDNTQSLFIVNTDSDPFPIDGESTDTTNLNGGKWPNGSWIPLNTQYYQVGDYLYLIDSTGDHKPIIMYFDLTTGAYTFRQIDDGYFSTKPWAQIPWGDVEALGSNVTLDTPGTVTGTFTLAASAAFFEVGMLGTYIRLCNGTALDGVVQVTGYIDALTASVTAVQTVPNASFSYGNPANPASFWQMSQWNNHNGYPRSVTGFQGRVIFGGSFRFPDTIWGSRISNQFDFEEVPSPNTTGVYGFASSAYLSDNSRPFTLTPNTAQSARIVSLASSKTLEIHTDKAEIMAYGSNGALGPNNVTFESSTSFGGRPVQPVRVNNYSTFVQANGYKVRDVVYNFNEDQYKSQDLTFLAEHLFIRTDAADIPDADLSTKSSFFPVDDIVQMLRWDVRSSYLLCRTRRGKLYYVTLDRDYSVNAWGRIVLGDEFHFSDEYPYNNQPKVLAMGERYGELYLITQRERQGSKIFGIEMMQAPWEYENNSQDASNGFVDKPVYLDYSTVCTGVDGPGSSEWLVPAYFGLSFYGLGATVSVVADGNYLGEFELDPGGVPGPHAPDALVDIGYPVNRVVVGYKYKGVLTTAGIEQGGQYGTPLGRVKRVSEIVVKLHNTGSCLVGKDMDNLEEVAIRDPDTPMDQPIQYFTGNKKITFSQGYENDYSVTVIQDKPNPLYVVSVATHGESDD